jgi:hypothetical protein
MTWSVHSRLYSSIVCQKISIDAYIEYCADSVGELAQVIAQSSELLHLEIHGGNLNTDTSLHALLSKIPQGRVLGLTHLVLNGLSARMDSQTLPHLRSLVYLDLSHLHDPNDWAGVDQTQGHGSTSADIYATLNREKIHLKHVVSNSDHAILDYLQSYSGLETLKMFSPDFRTTAAQSDALAYRFYQSVLPKHVNSIQVLEILPKFEGGWCYNLDNVFILLSQCNQFRSLCIALTCSIIEVPEPSEHNSGIHFQNHRYRDNVDDMVCLTIIGLAFLAHLTELL